MAVEKRELEVRGENVEKAVEAGLAQLGLTRNDVTIEVLDEGSGGFLGIGSRDAIVRLTVKAASQEAPQQEEAPVQETPVQEKEAAPAAAADIESTEEMPELSSANEREVALNIVNTLLEKMQVSAETTISLSEPDDLTGESRWVIDIEGNDLGVLIGPRGETLNSLQYVARLMTGHKLHDRPYFIVDIEGYRSRREQALARLAERMAKKVVARGKAMNLEPMPPNERRIIHMTLRDHDKVFTQSRGEGSRRQVRILLKR
ncbi:MAG: RNA-binding cell elongation regulator Jag/EloR [Candidatus Promineifilaceae bacterium]